MRFTASALAIVVVTGVGGSAQEPAAVQAPATWPTPAFMNELGCAPHLTFAEPSMRLRVTGSLDPERHLVFAKGSTVTINGGTEDGVQPGREYFVRRLQKRFGMSGPDVSHPVNVHTVGWVKVVSADTRIATATVTYACDAILTEDYLEPFAAPAVQTILDGQVRYENLARFLSGLEDRRTVGSREYMTIDRGTDHGVKPGTRIVVLRDKKEGPLVEVGEGIVLQVRPESSTVQLTRIRDAIYSGDLVAIAK